MTRFWFIAGSIAAGAVIGLGAFGAHALGARVGGVCFIVGWIALALAAINGQDRPSCSP